MAADVVIVGRVLGAYGVRGWVRIQSFTRPTTNIEGYDPWLIRDAESWREIEVGGLRKHGDGYVAKLSGVDDRERAEQLHGHEIGVGAAALPALDPGEYYWRDIEGLRVRDLGGRPLGTVDRLMETGANDVIVVKDDVGRESLIPFVGAVVVEVDLAGSVMTVDWSDDMQ